jgi:hypothetical protein
VEFSEILILLKEYLYDPIDRIRHAVAIEVGKCIEKTIIFNFDYLYIFNFDFSVGRVERGLDRKMIVPREKHRSQPASNIGHGFCQSDGARVLVWNQISQSFYRGQSLPTRQEDKFEVLSSIMFFVVS